MSVKSNINSKLQNMKQRFKNTHPIHKSRIEQFWKTSKQMKKSTPIQRNYSILSPQRIRINYTQSIQKTKSLKKHNYFGSQVNDERNNKNKQKQSGIGNVLEQLANYVEEKNGEIPWTKRYDWEDMLVSSGKGSQEKDDQYLIESKNVFDENSLSTKKEDNRGNNYFSYQKQQEKIEQKNEPKRQQQQWQSQTESLVDFLLRINKISQTQSFNNNKEKKQQEKQKYENKPSTNVNVNINDSDSDDFEQLMRMVEKQEQKRKMKRDNSHKQQQQKKQSSYDANKYDDSPVVVVARRGGGRVLVSDDDQDQVSIVKMKKVNNNNKNTNNKNNNNYKRQSQYKPCRLKKQRQQQTTCTICMCDITQRTRLQQCKHQFCLECIKDWLQKTSSCPICRKDSSFYLFNNQKHRIQQKQYSLENYVNNIGGDSDDDSDQQYDDDDVDYQCENCQSTQIGDEIIICDGCLVNATHVECDEALGGIVPPEEMNWYCSVCREGRMLWFIHKRSLAGR